MSVSPEITAKMRDAARAASQLAHCPYSRFRVGAAVLDEHGRIYSGCNVENASYGLTICAERNAIFQLVAAGGRKVRAVVVYTPTPRPTPPCGACRQVINEFASSDAPVLSWCDGGGTLAGSFSEFFPFTLGADEIKVGG